MCIRDRYMGLQLRQVVLTDSGPAPSEFIRGEVSTEEAIARQFPVFNATRQVQIILDVIYAGYNISVVDTITLTFRPAEEVRSAILNTSTEDLKNQTLDQKLVTLSSLNQASTTAVPTLTAAPPPPTSNSSNETVIVRSDIPTDCPSSICSNKGLCKNDKGKGFCTCEKGWAGVTCELSEEQLKKETELKTVIVQALVDVKVDSSNLLQVSGATTSALQNPAAVDDAILSSGAQVISSVADAAVTAALANPELANQNVAAIAESTASLLGAIDMKMTQKDLANGAQTSTTTVDETKTAAIQLQMTQKFEDSILTIAAKTDVKVVKPDLSVQSTGLANARTPRRLLQLGASTSTNFEYSVTITPTDDNPNKVSPIINMRAGYADKLEGKSDVNAVSATLISYKNNIYSSVDKSVDPLTEIVTVKFVDKNNGQSLTAGTDPLLQVQIPKLVQKVDNITYNCLNWISADSKWQNTSCTYANETATHVICECKTVGTYAAIYNPQAAMAVPVVPVTNGTLFNNTVDPTNAAIFLQPFNILAVLFIAFIEFYRLQ
eukprot:TRINITY_DN251_c0_g1_i2.p1 TRINITY_DN251_c0_g1~~TRINITY_DN251_c0_g1_i2.p1  ORF type:complete len:592 (+),score=215.12 TRINITY_DN251_c0_g1_i2:128-1777(+)